MGLAALAATVRAMASRKRILLLVVAGLLSASALLAIGILLAGRFGRTEGRILGTTALLAGYGLVALPATILLDRPRSSRLAVGALVLAAVGVSLALAAIWTDGGDELGRAVGTVTAFALASAQSCALAARRHERDPMVVRRLFAVSLTLAFAVAAMLTALLWAGSMGGGSVRGLGALAVLDLLAVGLQPILARARPVAPLRRLRIVVEPGETVVLDVEAVDLAAAVAKAIRTVERGGRRIVGIEVGEPPAEASETELTPSRGAPAAHARG
jgi:hypothetical protein